MDIKEYIASNILTNYVLGLVTEQERQEVECMAHIYPEVKSELEELQQTMERMAMSLSKDPPKDLKAKVLSAIDGVEQIQPDEKTAEPVKGTPVDRPDTKSSSWWKIGLALLTLLSAILLMLLLNSSNKQTEILDESSKLKIQNTELKTLNDSLIKTIQEKEFVNTIIAQTDTRMIEMPGTKNNPDAAAQVYWNPKQGDVLLKVDNLPVPPSDKQYQLWAIVDGKPKDMGVLTIADATKEIQRIPVKVVNSSDAFAITLERKGGSPTPNLDALVVYGGT